MFTCTLLYWLLLVPPRSSFTQNFQNEIAWKILIGICYELMFRIHLTIFLSLRDETHHLSRTFILVCQFGNKLLLLAIALHKSVPDTVPIMFSYPSASRQIPILFPAPPPPLDLDEIYEIEIPLNKP